MSGEEGEVSKLVRIGLWSVGGLFVFAVLACCGLGMIGVIGQEMGLMEKEPESSSERSSANENATWNDVETFSGTGKKNTPPFEIEAEKWRVSYRSESTSGIGEGAGHIFTLQLMRPGEEFPVETLANAANQKVMENTSYVYESGQFYLEVNSSNGEWTIEVEEYR